MGILLPSLVKFGQVVLKRSKKCLKVPRHTDERTDNGEQAIRKAHFNLRFMSAKKRRKIYKSTNLFISHFYFYKKSQSEQLIVFISITTFHSSIFR